MFLDVVSSFAESGRNLELITGGVYGISSKPFTPNMIKAIYDNMASQNPKKRFVVGVEDDVTNTSLEVGERF